LIVFEKVWIDLDNIRQAVMSG